jgi:phage terminase small subunit
VQWRSAATETEGEGRKPNIRVVNVVQLKNAKDLAPDIAAAIAEVSQLPNGGLRVKLHDKLAALAELGRHLGISSQVSEEARAIRVEIVRFGEDQDSE